VTSYFPITGPIGRDATTAASMQCVYGLTPLLRGIGGILFLEDGTLRSSNRVSCIVVKHSFWFNGHRSCRTTTKCNHVEEYNNTNTLCLKKTSMM